MGRGPKQWTGTEGMDNGKGVFLRFDVQRFREEERKERKTQIEEGRHPLYRQLRYALSRVTETP